MAAPTVGAIGSFVNGFGPTVAVPVPASVVSGSVVVVVLYTDGTSTISGMGTTGLVHAPNSPQNSRTAGGGTNTINVLWKRATGADSGTYTLTQSAGVFMEGAAFRVDGAVASGSPWDVTTSAASTSNVTSSPSVSVTTSGADELLIHGSTNENGGNWTASTGFTQDFGTTGGPNKICFFAHKAQAVAGSSGAVVAVCAASQEMTAWLGALLPAGGGGPTPVALTESGTESEAVVVSATVPVAETGSGSDASQVSATVPITDSATGSDAAQVSATVPASDAGSGSDAVAVTAAIHPVDTGSANEAITANATVPLADSGTGTDSISVNTGATPITLTESGSAADAITESVTAPLAEVGTASDSLAISAHLNLAETGSASDTLTILVHASLTDSAAALDSLGATATIHLTDAAAGVDGIVTPGGSTTITLTDTGSACECLTVVLLRPSTGTIGRPSTGTTSRPNSGSVSRPSTGTITRPNTGVVHAPGHCDCH